MSRLMPDTSSIIGRTLSHYDVLERLGDVYKRQVLATHADRKQFAAVKKKIRAVEYRELARAIVCLLYTSRCV